MNILCLKQEKVGCLLILEMFIKKGRFNKMKLSRTKILDLSENRFYLVENNIVIHETY